MKYYYHEKTTAYHTDKNCVLLNINTSDVVSATLPPDRYVRCWECGGELKFNPVTQREADIIASRFVADLKKY